MWCEEPLDHGNSAGMSRTEVNYQSGVGTFASWWAPRAVALTPHLELPVRRGSMLAPANPAGPELPVMPRLGQGSFGPSAY